MQCLYNLDVDIKIKVLALGHIEALRELGKHFLCGPGILEEEVGDVDRHQSKLDPLWRLVPRGQVELVVQRLAAGREEVVGVARHGHKVAAMGRGKALQWEWGWGEGEKSKYIHTYI